MLVSPALSNDRYVRSEVKESLISHSLKEHLPSLAKFSSSKALKKSSLYKALCSQIDQVMNSIEFGLYAREEAQKKKPFYRAVAWNVERGIVFEGVKQVLLEHPEISKADLLFLTETDIGMIRTQNRNIAQELSKALEMNYFFTPSYLNLCQGNSIESHYKGENELGLHGNAFLSRYPIENLRLIPLKNCKDKMKGSEKRLGSQTALIADVLFPQGTITVAEAHLDAHSSQRQRADQIKDILKPLQNNPYPILFAGDLNTSCYNARHALFAFFGFWNKVFRGVDDVIENHYPYPDRYYDRFLFKVFRDNGLDYQSVNETGVGTLHYSVEDIRGNHLIQEVVPQWCRRIMEETLKRHGGKVSLKLDWFASKGVKKADPTKNKEASAPKVISDLSYEGKPLSDHDPILLDIEI